MTKDNLIRWCRPARNFLGALCLILMPYASFGLFEYVTGNLANIPPYMAALNIAWISVLYLAVFAVSGSSKTAVPVVSLFLYALSLGETFVVEFRARPIMLWDVTAFTTAMTVAENYRFQVTEAMKMAGVGVLAMNVVTMLFPFRVRGRWLRGVLAGTGAGAIAGFGLWFFASLVPSWDLRINMWAMTDTYEKYGYILATAVSGQYMLPNKPEGYSPGRVEEIYEEAAAQEGPERESVTPVNVICIMNESLSDLAVAGDFETNQEYFPFISSLRENTVRGSLCVPVFGSMTSNSEFEFLTGDTMAFLPNGCSAYQFYIHPGLGTLVSTLSDQGYRSVAVHPYPGANWNRETCYENMGFDEFLDIEDFSYPAQLRNYTSDQADYEMLINLVQQKEDPSDRLFLFNVTMQNHGGYEGTYENFPQEVWLTGDMEGKYPKADQYLSLMKRSDDAFRFLLEYFSNSSEPTMILMFGDHQPSVENEFYDEIAGRPSSQVPAGESIMWYETPFLIWTNYDSPEKDMGRLGAVYLSSQMLSQAGLEMTPYNRFLLDLQEVLPVIHPFGVYTADGAYYSWEEARSEGFPYREQIMEYEYLVYNQLFDTRHTVEEMFLLEGEAEGGK